jgi:hypothetical protein
VQQLREQAAAGQHDTGNVTTAEALERLEQIGRKALNSAAPLPEGATPQHPDLKGVSSALVKRVHADEKEWLALRNAIEDEAFLARKRFLSSEKELLGVVRHLDAIMKDARTGTFMMRTLMDKLKPQMEFKDDETIAAMLRELGHRFSTYCNIRGGTHPDSTVITLCPLQSPAAAALRRHFASFA